MLRATVLLLATVLVGCDSAERLVAMGEERLSPEPNKDGQVRADIATLFEAYGAPSVSYAVIRDGDIVRTGNLGFADLASGREADELTQYGIGSVVKSFTSGLVGILDAEGALSLGDHPAEYVPNLDLPSPELQEGLRLDQLLSQTSGLPALDGTLAFFPANDQAELAPRYRFFEPVCAPGDCWNYNNLNFITLDMVAEAVTGESKAQLLKERIFKAVGMKDSVASTEAFEASANAATGYARVREETQRTRTEYLYGEHVYATAPDLARWLSAWMPGGPDVLPSDYIGKALSMQAIKDGSPPSAEEPGIYLFGYGFGWEVKSVDGHYVVHHGGDENGFAVQVMMVPAERLGVVTITNQQGSLLPYMVNDILLRDALSLPRPPLDQYPVIVREGNAPLSSEEALLELLPDEPLNVPVDSLLGTYRAEGYGEVQVQLSAGVLELVTPAAAMVLSHQGGTRFGLGATVPVPIGANLAYFSAVFGEGTLALSIAAEPVVFTKVQ